MKTINILFLAISILIFGCQDASKETGNNSLDSLSKDEAKADALDQHPDFVFSYNPNKEISDEDVMKALAGKYVSESGNSNACDCSEKTCYKQELQLKHYFKASNIISALAVVGNSCSSENASRVDAGWCDVALFELENGNWKLKKFWAEAGGGADWGSSGDVGEAFQIAKAGIGIPIGWGSSAQGYSYEGENIIGYVDGEVKEMAELQLHLDNSGNAIDDNDYECTCMSYAFSPDGNEANFSLKLVKKDCSKSKDENNCEGEMVNTATVQMEEGEYSVPDNLKIW